MPMQIIERVHDMSRWSEAQRRDGRYIAFIPTMGFLHEAHLRLVRDGKKRGDRVVVSIFVNPKQFAPSEDFAAYPRDFARDRELLERERIDVLFHPSADEIYPAGFQTQVSIDKLSRLLCAPYRPGHFQGGATVVANLFDIVQARVAIFGEQNYQ